MESNRRQLAYSSTSLKSERLVVSFARVADGTLVKKLSPLSSSDLRALTVSLALTVKGEPDEIVVNVKNRGPVIAAEFFEAIFNPLVQLNIAAGDSSRPPTTLGLGLHIARSIAVAHDGTISVTSTEKDGTVFTVRLPRDQRRRS